MARRKANGAAQSAIKVTDEASFNRLVRQIANAQKGADEARDTIGGLISAAAEKRNLHKRAFSIFRSLHKLSDAHLATTLAHFRHYCVVGGLDARAERQGQLIADASVEEGGAEVARLTQLQREASADFEMAPQD